MVNSQSWKKVRIVVWGKPQFTSWIENGRRMVCQKVFGVLLTERDVDAAKMTNVHYTRGFLCHVI